MLPRYVQTRAFFAVFIAKAIKYELAGYLFVGVGAAIGVPLLVEWFFPQYVSSIPLFLIMLLLLIPTAIDAIFNGAFFALQAQRNLFFASIYKLLLVFICLPPLLYFFGLYGAAYASVLIQALYVIERHRALKKILPEFSLSFKTFITIDEHDMTLLTRIRDYVKRLPVISRMVHSGS